MSSMLGLAGVAFLILAYRSYAVVEGAKVAIFGVLMLACFVGSIASIGKAPAYWDGECSRYSFNVSEC